MAISIIDQPDALHPAYNDVIYKFDSTNKLEPDFKYIVDIYDVATVPTLLKRWFIQPEPINDWCEINLSQFLQSKVSFNLTQLYTNGASTANLSQFPYTLKIGEEYKTIWTYDFVSRNIDTNQTFTGYVRLVSTSTLHSYSIGDYITIEQVDGGILYPILEGTFVIVAVPNTQTIVINLLYNLLSDTTPLPTIIDGDTSKVGDISLFPDLLVIDQKCVNNASFKIPDYINYDFSDWSTVVATSSTKFFTNQPSDNFYMYDSQESYTMFSYYSGTSSGVTKVRYENSNGDIIESGSITANQSLVLKPWLRLIQTGPGNNNATSAVTGTLPLIKSDTEWYDFWLVNASNNQISEKKRVYINRRCKINDTEVLFLDKLGSWSSFAFEIKQFEDVKVSKQTYNKTLDYSTNLSTFEPWLYGGDVVYNSTVQRNYRINTNWMTEEMSDYFEELVSSPMTLMRFSSSDDYFPVNVLTDSIENEKFKNTKLIKKSLVVKSAWGEKVNI
jgi:hypothetical protein